MLKYRLHKDQKLMNLKNKNEKGAIWSILIINFDVFVIYLLMNFVNYNPKLW